jgi:hypothetical protein
VARRLKSKRERRQKRRLLTRAAERVRALFSTTPPEELPEASDEREGGLGVREPRRPLRPNLGGAVALEIPPAERTDIRAVGEEDRE